MDESFSSVVRDGEAANWSSKISFQALLVLTLIFDVESV